MPKATIEEAIDQQYPRVRPGRAILPALLRRWTPARRGGRELERIDYIPASGVEQEPLAESGGLPPFKIISFLLIVVIPFVASTIYFAFVASDQYVAEARFAVRALGVDTVDYDGSENGGSGPQGSIGALSMRKATQDAYVVQSFIRSTDILDKIGEKLDYRSMFARDDADFLSRFHAPGSNERFLAYWEDHVSAYIDVSSGIITLKVRSFRPQDSVQLASAIIEQSEMLINDLSQRARNDAVRNMQADVQRTGKAYGETLTALNRFQHDSGLLSPQTQADDSSRLLTGLMAQKLDFETRLFVMKQSNAGGGPAYQQLTLALQSLDQQIEKVKAGLTGPESASLAQTLLDYSKLETDRVVAENLYEAAQRNYESVLAEAVRKSLYLAVFVQPSLPEEAAFPHRLTTPLIILLALVVAWATFTLVLASIDDHRL